MKRSACVQMGDIGEGRLDKARETREKTVPELDFIEVCTVVGSGSGNVEEANRGRVVHR